MQNLAWVSYVGGRADEAEGRLTESAECSGDRRPRWPARGPGTLGFVRYHQGRDEDAERLAAWFSARAERGDKWGQGMMLISLAAVRLWSGRAAAAIDVADESLALFRSVGDLSASQQGAWDARALPSSPPAASRGWASFVTHSNSSRPLEGADEQRVAVAAYVGALGEPDRRRR